MRVTAAVERRSSQNRIGSGVFCADDEVDRRVFLDEG
jgi:hypothetical protein